jgi:hypothetical protein
MTKEGEIDQVQDATDEEKAEARTQAEAAAQKGKSTIDRVPTNGEVLLVWHLVFGQLSPF